MNKKIINIFIRKARTLINKPSLLFVKALYFLSPLLNNRIYLKLLFPLKVGYKLDLDNPKTYNEKLQWLKLYYRDPLLPKLVDKYEYKEYVSKIVGEEYVVKNFGIWNSFDEIDFDKLPSQFVLKTTHDQGGVVVCKDKSKFDFKKAKKKINKHLKNNLYPKFREWPYKTIKPRIIAEEFLVNDNNEEVKDYKFYCFNGEPKALYIASERQSGMGYFDFFDIDFNFLDIERYNHKQSGKKFTKPENYELMVELARKMSAGQPHVRIDFYNIDGKILFGEYTLFQGAGLMPFYPEKWDYKFGSWLDLNTVDSKKVKF